MVVLLQLAAFGYSQHCEYLGNTITCQKIQQEEFLNRILSLAATYPEEYIETIEISNSNFSRIDYLPNPSKSIRQFRVQTLIIKHSNITYIADDALNEYTTLGSLILRDNQIENTSFATVFGSQLSILDLDRNSIKILDLDNLKDIHYSSVYLQENNIEYIKPSSQHITFFSLDLSYNNIQEFNETYLNCFSISIDLSYNRLNTLYLISKLSSRQKDRVDIKRNNVFSVGDSGFTCNELYTTSLINATMSIENVLSLHSSNIGILNRSVWDISKFEIGSSYSSSYGQLDLSNASISNISQYFFDNRDEPIGLLNLSHNNINSLEHGIFRNLIIRSLDLSFSGIKNVSGNSFEGLRDFKNLKLAGNQMETIQNICKSATELTSIDLSFNKLQSIDLDTFASCTQLNTLNISNSVMNFIEPGILSSLISLRVIDLSSSNITYLKAFTFSNSSTIKQIDLSNNNLKILENNVFYNLSVETLKLSNSHIYYISGKAFNYLYNLRLLDLSGCRLTNIEEDSFFNLPLIREIDLSNNYLISIPTHAFRNMKGLSLNLSRNRIESLNDNAFENVELNYLDLSSNRLSGINTNSVTNTSIQELSLLDNNISASISIDDSVNLTSLSVSLNGVFEHRSISSIYLKKLYLVESSLELLKNDCFVEFPYLEVLYFNKSRIETLELGALHGLYSLEHLDAPTLFNNSKILRNGTLSDLFRLKSLHIETPMLSSLERGSLSGLQSLEILNITGTGIQTLPSGIFNDLKNLRILDLSNNSLINLDSNTFFENLTQLTNLYLQHNRLSSMPQKLLINLHKLVILRLDGNALNGFVAGGFDGLEALVSLNLSQNTNLFRQNGAYSAVALRTLKNLQIMNIANTYIDERILDYSTLRISFPKLKSISINSNRFPCTGLLKMLEYFEDRSITYTPENPTYDTPNLNGIACIAQ
ncbi:unnamed protein product [Phaedon cochleariae]|uniref:Chaoptin n=1 Tax=Phaedon cochleariae TaxID=80249 RepID=A0A9P0DL54_PHACE|nr:unnamed protein product [Phaedon cochleariae]